MSITKLLLLCSVSLTMLLSNATLPGVDYSPPGLELSYLRMDKVISSKKYNNTHTWYITQSHSFLLPTWKDDNEYKRISISTFEIWYCMEGFPTYCAPLDGLDGVLLNNPKNHVWPN